MSNKVRVQDQPNKVVVEGDGELVKVVGQGPQGPKGDPRTAAVSVTDETPFGLSPVVGSSVAFAREDHSHGSQPREVPDPASLATDDLLTVAGGVYVGVDEVTVDQLNFDTLAAETLTTAGEMAWNDTDGTVDLVMKGGNVVQQIGMEQYIRARHDNNSGITKGVVYYLSGSSGGVKEVLPAQANSATTCKTTIGVASESTTGGGQAFITTFGLVRDLPNSQFVDVTEGTVVYLSSTTAGAFTSTPPTPPNHRVIVGFCVRKQSNNNELFVAVQTGLDVDELCDVFAPSPVAGQVLAYNGVTSRYELTTLTAADVGAYPDTNPSNFVDAAGASAAAPVQSVNGGTGVVVLDAGDVGAYPDTNPSSFIDAAGAPVQSVNTQTGAVTLGAADVGAVPTSRTISTSGTGLSGGGDLSADRTITLDPSALAGDVAFTGAYAPLLLTETTTRTANYTLALTDQGKVVPMDGTDLDLTVPLNSAVAFPVGSVVNVYNLNATVVTIAGDSGVTVRNDGDLAQYGEVSLRKRATDEWVVAGNLS